MATGGAIVVADGMSVGALSVAWGVSPFDLAVDPAGVGAGRALVVAVCDVGLTLVLAGVLISVFGAGLGMD